MSPEEEEPPRPSWYQAPELGQGRKLSRGDEKTAGSRPTGRQGKKPSQGPAPWVRWACPDLHPTAPGLSKGLVSP